MARLSVDSVTVNFPIYNHRMRSLRHTVMDAGVGGRIGRLSGNLRTVCALRDVSLEIYEGDRIALLGRNGAGKTTLLRVLSGAYEPTKGHVYREGKIVSLLNVSVGMDRESSGYENIFMRGLFLGLSTNQIRTRIDDIAEFTELGDYLALPLYTYSTGMRLRLAFGICTSFPAEILLMDEWLGAGDREFMDKAKSRLRNLVDRAGILVLASHNTTLLKRVCTRGVLLESGSIQCTGPLENLMQDRT